jgi:hypothetical protein
MVDLVVEWLEERDGNLEIPTCHARPGIIAPVTPWKIVGTFGGQRVPLKDQQSAQRRQARAVEAVFSVSFPLFFRLSLPPLVNEQTATWIPFHRTIPTATPSLGPTPRKLRTTGLPETEGASMLEAKWKSSETSAMAAW